MYNIWTSSFSSLVIAMNRFEWSFLPNCASGRRTITEVPDNELKEAVMDMVNRLHIPGQGNGYDLYTAILEEKKKAYQYLKKLSSTED